MGIRGRALSVGKSHARNATAQNPTPNRPRTDPNHTKFQYSVPPVELEEEKKRHTHGCGVSCGVLVVVTSVGANGDKC